MVAGAGCSGDDDDGGGGPTSGASTADGSGGAPSSTGTDGPGATSVADESGSSSGGLIMTACGTFDPNVPGDSVAPQDPDDPEIIAACTSLCEAAGAATDCMTEQGECIDACKMRSCAICPGTLVPLVECETSMLDATGCSCDGAGPVCTTPEGCSDEAAATGFCGG